MKFSGFANIEYLTPEAIEPKHDKDIPGVAAYDPKDIFER